MSQKAQILLLFVIFIIIIILGAGLVLISSIVNTNGVNTNNTNGNTDETPTNELDPEQIMGGNKAADYKYAVINADDTVTLFTEEGKRYDLFLQRQSYQNISWSPDSSVISVKAKRDINSVLDLRYFFLFDQTNRWVTDYSISKSGIGEYFWLDDETVLFMQGETSSKWLHRYFYPSESEILKIFNSNSKIIDNQITKDDEEKVNYLTLIQNNINGVFSIINSENKVIWNSENLIDEDENKVTPISVRFMVGTDKIIITAEENGVEYYYKGSTQDNSVAKLEDILNGEFIASANADEFISLRREGLENTTLVFEKIDSLKNVTTKLAEYEIGRNTMDIKDISYTTDDGIMFSISDEFGKKSWFTLADNRIQEVLFLKNSKEVRIAPRFGGVNGVIR